MSTPPDHKELWKNCSWKNEEEKLVFFNHYFKKGHIADNYCKDKIDAFKEGLIEFIKGGKIKEGNKERDITKQDIINEIEKK